MKEIRWHGRGGEGAVVAARILAASFLLEGKSAIAFPKFGFERRGAPVVAFTRFDEMPIREKTQIYNPDCVVVVNPRLMQTVNVFEGLKENGIFVLDSSKPETEKYHPNLLTVGAVDATRIALEEIGRPITNTCMLGAFARSTEWLQLDSILSSLDEYFRGIVLERNINCVTRGYKEATITSFKGAL